MLKKVLLVDDSVTIHKIVDLTLDRKHFELSSAYNIEDGMAAILNEKPAALMIDSKLFNSAGEEKILSIKKSNPRIAVILLVGAYDQFAGPDLEYPIIDEYLVKPFNSNILNAVLIDIINKKGYTGEQPQSTASAAPEPMALPMESPDENIDAIEIAKEDLMPQDEPLTDKDPEIIETETGFERVSAMEAVIIDADSLETELTPSDGLGVSPASEISLGSPAGAFPAQEADIEDSFEAVPLFDEESLSQMGISLEELMQEDDEITDRAFVDFTADETFAPEPAVGMQPIDEPPMNYGLIDEADADDGFMGAFAMDEIGSEDEAASIEYSHTSELNLEEIFGGDAGESAAEASPDGAASPMAEMLDIIDEAMEVRSGEPIDLTQMNELIDNLDVDPLASDTLDIKVEDIMEPDKYDFMPDDASFDNVESAMHDGTEASEHSHHENTAENLDTAGGMSDAFSADEPDLFVNVPVFEEPVARAYEQIYSNDGEADIEERKELMSLFDELHLNFDSSQDDAGAEGIKPEDALHMSVAGVELPEEKAVPAGEARKVDLISGGVGEIAPKTKEASAKLVIELPKEELTQLLAHAINKEMLEKIIKEALKESIGESVEKLVPQIAESLVRDELRMIKGEK